MLLHQPPTTAEKVNDFFMFRIMPAFLVFAILASILALAHNYQKHAAAEAPRKAECQSWFAPPNQEITALVAKVCDQYASAWLLPPRYESLEIEVATKYLKTDVPSDFADR